MKKILVTGAGGYIGTTLVPLLLEQGFAVRAVDRYFFGCELLAPAANLEIVTEDTRRLTAKHFEGVDAVIDLAAISNDPSGELFQNATWEINHKARAHTAKLAKEAGASRYVFPSSCSIYGFQNGNLIADEVSATNPLTTYAKANEAAERDVLQLSDNDFTVVVLRQATVYGYSPRMRFDIAINGMTFGAWQNRVLPLMRDGEQWRPFVHVRDTAGAMIFMLSADAAKINGQIFNVGNDANVYKLKDLGRRVAAAISNDIKIEWYGDVDHRSYRVGFHKIETLGWRATRTVEDGVAEILEALQAGKTDKTPQTLTLEWYKLLQQKFETTGEGGMYGGILDLSEAPQKRAVG